MRKTVIGVMGPGDGATKKDTTCAYESGKLIAQNGWVLLTGGRVEGVMDAASRGAKDAGGLVVGVLPTPDTQGMSEAVDVAIVTGMGSGRNSINVLSSDVIVACGIGAGTASEIALAIKAGKQVILLSNGKESQVFFKKIGEKLVSLVDVPKEAIKRCEELLKIL